MSQITDKQADLKWDEYVKNIRRATPVPIETQAEKNARIARLLKDWKAFCKYYFPNYTKSEFAKWQVKHANKVINSDKIRLTEKCFRGGAKSVRYGLFLPLFEKFNGRMRNMLYISQNYDKAETLLMPIFLNLEHNQRLIADFGEQKGFYSWQKGNFITRDGCSFLALGAGQDPRGVRNEEVRPDFILIDDLDTDSERKNQKLIDERAKWALGALYGCFDLTGRMRFIAVGNRIHKKSALDQIGEKADFCVEIPIEKNGTPTWPEAMTMEQIKYMQGGMTYSTIMMEHYHIVVVEGTVFKKLAWGAVPPLARFKFLVNYLDCTYKSSETKNGSYKAMALVGMLNGKLYKIKDFCDKTTLDHCVRWFWQMHDYVGGKTSIYHYVEKNGLQDAWYDDVFLPALKKAQAELGYQVSVSPDARSKPDKFIRIEAALEVLDRNGDMIFNEAEKENPHMQTAYEQFESVEPNLSAPADAPDATEGGHYIITNKLRELTPIKTGTSHRSTKKRF